MEEYPEEVALYIADAYGTRENGKRHTEPLKTLLSSLGDEEVVHVDIGKDDICNSCQIGKHCTATNYRLWGETSQTNNREKEEIDKILQDLNGAGFTEGVDFIFLETSHELLDYGGEGLWDDVTPNPQTMTFKSMLVKMYALRKIFAR